ncbi:ATP-dependent helicase [Clostridium tyrobutyricum]|uniref:ATP-dependent helicase n=1 Tax=Clostridium tyrobutyricum TaxID=1519 RepID=UPI001C39496F|nr:ATP-dependent helicase [Clostridium tyrobutyricum]MBV4414664.1 ATP-dependent helicase [Clostridium tyrobutyricum]
MKYNLTKLQRDVVNSDGRIILKSCPGSGKTFVVANKILKEMNDWKQKNKGIALLSFTNIASKEMEKQINKIYIGYKIGYPHYLGTLDSFISRYIFLPFGDLIMECDKRPSIIQEYSVSVNQYAKKIWRRECYRKGCLPLEFSYDSKNNLKYKNKIISDCRIKLRNPCVQFKRYCFKHGYATYSDVISIAIKILRKYPNISKLLCGRFPYVIIDEAQDTSKEQMEILEILCECGLKNVMLIGDPDQAIYEWRDADPSVFLNKYQDKRWNPKLLNENFRCSQRICNATKIFSTLPNISKAAGETSDYKFKPQIVKYSIDKKKDLIEYFLKVCKDNRIEINEKNVAVLVRGKTELLEKDYSQIKDLWQSPLAKLLSEASFEKWNKSVKRLVNLIERALYSLYICCDYDNIIEEEKIEKKIPLDVWHKLIFEFCKNIPDGSLVLKEWKEKVIHLISKITDEYDLDIVGNSEVKIKSRTRNKKLQDFLQQSVKDFYAKAYNLGYLNTTIHSVKGRTFEAVLLIIARNGKLTSNLINTKPIESEPVRTAYVAMTRARKILVVGIPKSIKNKSMVRFPIKDWEYHKLSGS